MVRVVKDEGWLANENETPEKRSAGVIMIEGYKRVGGKWTVAGDVKVGNEGTWRGRVFTFSLVGG